VALLSRGYFVLNQVAVRTLQLPDSILAPPCRDRNKKRHTQKAIRAILFLIEPKDTGSGVNSTKRFEHAYLISSFNAATSHPAAPPRLDMLTLDA
jgi:hypothetical protein